MGLHPQNIGISMPHGYAGGYARQPDMIVNTRPAGAQIVFGAALKYDSSHNVVPMGEGDGATAFVGVAAREIKSALSYLDQNTGMYAEREAVPVFMRGAVNVICQKGTPQLGGVVYIRIAGNESYPGAAVGGFEAEADEENTVYDSVYTADFICNEHHQKPAARDRILPSRLYALSAMEICYTSPRSP